MPMIDCKKVVDDYHDEVGIVPDVFLPFPDQWGVGVPEEDLQPYPCAWPDPISKTDPDFHSLQNRPKKTGAEKRATDSRHGPHRTELQHGRTDPRSRPGFAESRRKYLDRSMKVNLVQDKDKEVARRKGQ